jgi:hypothetical protein
MAVLSSISVDWAQSPRVITVASPVLSVSVQDLYDTLRDLEDEPVNMSFGHLISAGGKETLDAALGSAVGITATLLNAVLKFEDRGSPTICKVPGGNLVAVDDMLADINPVAFSTNVLVIIAQSASPTSITTAGGADGPVEEIKQAWTRAVTGGSKMRAMIALEIDGVVVVLPGTATMTVTVYDASGIAVINQTGITANVAGYFALTEDPYVPIAGVNLASFATITNGGDVYGPSLTPISFPEFA